ncbi:MAG: nuclease superfamily, partial [Thermoleophilia bacterium]|nr:nuclease superfamily [Thermoleophilia bacterium]
EEAARGTLDQAELLVADREPWLTERTVARLQPIVDTQVFSRLVARGARAEVPWLASFGTSIASPASEGVRVVADARDVDAGRIDALAILPDGRWWVVDWKVSLDDAAADAWHEHGRQLTRYAVAARRAGAPGCVLTLASLGASPVVHSWDGSELDVTDLDFRAPEMPQLHPIP